MRNNKGNQGKGELQQNGSEKKNQENISFRLKIGKDEEEEEEEENSSFNGCLRKN